MDKFTATPKLAVDVIATADDGSTKVTEISEGVIVKDLAFKEGTAVVTKTGKVTEIMVTTKAAKPDYTKCPCNLESAYADSVTVDGFVLDASSVYGADVSMVFIKDIKSIGEVMQGSTVVNLATAEEGAIAKAISELKPGQELVLSSGTVTEDIVVPAGAVVRGANAGVSAATGYRASENPEGETVFSGTLTVGGENVVLDGITLTSKALPRIGDAVVTLAEDAEVEGKDINFTMRNCRVIGLDDGSTGKQYGIKPLNWEDNILMIVENCYFGPSEKVYNLFELNCTLQSGSSFSNNYLTKGAFSNNAFCFYRVAEGAFIDVIGNVFEYAANGMRIGPKGDVRCTFNVKNNTYKETAVPEYDEEGNVTSNWGGLMIIQPYGTLTTSMKGVTINMTGTKNETTNTQMWYYYEDKGTSRLDVANRPTVVVDGVVDSYEGKEWIF